MLSVRPYTAEDAPAWDALVARSRNGNMLHQRAYMDYHAARFSDCSLVVEKSGTMLAVFPANRRDRQVVSHGGLTYAGLITTCDVRAQATLEVFARIASHYRDGGADSVYYKAIPQVFHRYPADEDLYALQRLGARLQRRDLSSVIALQAPFRFSASRRRSITRARTRGIRCGVAGDPAPFHGLLTDVLAAHGTAPVHTLAELRLLQARFPGQITLYEARHDDDTLLAGVLVYDFGHAVHTQYLAVSPRGRQLDALSLLLADLIERVYAQRHYFSFGISTEQEGQVLNARLAEQKERFGARAVVHDFYHWAL